MIGRVWEFAVGPERVAAFEEFAGSVALPMVRGRMGCSAVYVLRDSAGAGRYAWVTLWLSRKALDVAAASPEWERVAAQLAAFGLPFDPAHARSYDAIASFRAGETV